MDDVRCANMRETNTDLDELQDLLDRSYASGGEHLRSIFDPEHCLSADELIAALDGIFELHLASTSASGAPLVAPVDGIFFRGRIWFGLVPRSVRAARVHRDARVSASYTRAPSFAVIAHGIAEPADTSSARFVAYEALLRELYVDAYGPRFNEWYDTQRRERAPGAGFIGWLEPRLLFAKR